MKTYLECIPCFVRQALEAARFASADPVVHEEVMRRVLHEVHGMPLTMVPPAMGRQIHRIVRSVTGGSDPYRELKDLFNRLAVELLPELREMCRTSGNPRETAVRLAIAGNLIDSAAKLNLQDMEIRDVIDHAMKEELEGSVAELFSAVERADDILYLTDNCGEIVLDRLLIEQLPLEKVTVAVRGEPTINDATLEDAVTAGLDQLVTVMDNGSDTPGTLLDDCSEAFRTRFAAADLVIAKGQGNYESLSGVDKNIFFLLRTKCPVIAEHLGTEVGRMVIARPDVTQEDETKA